MIRYFRRADGQLVPRFFDAGDAIPKRIRCDDGKMARYNLIDNICAEPVPAVEAWRRGCALPACGIGRVQIAEEMKRMEKAVGHPVEWKRSKYGGGDPVAHSRHERNEIMKACGMKDNDAGFGDWAGES